MDTHLDGRPRREDDVEDSLLYRTFAVCVKVMISHAPPRTPNHARSGVRTKGEIILTHGPAKLLSSNCLVRISATMYAFMDAPHADACVSFGKTVPLGIFISFSFGLMKKVKSGKVTAEASALGLPLSRIPSALGG